MALPTLNRTIDDDFMNTWYEIRPDMIDNILEATVLTLALREFGCMVPQVGGEYVTRPVSYGEKAIQAFDAGTTLEQSVVELDTMARWDWRFFLVDINRTWVDDKKNAGQFQIKSYIARRMEAARDAIVQDMEDFLMRWGVYTATPYLPNGLYDIAPLYAAESAVGAGAVSGTQATGSSNGNISRTNAWWRSWVMYNTGTYSKANRIAGDTQEPYSLNLQTDLGHAFNCCRANQEAPNLILTSQAIYEAYEEDVQDRHQVVRSAFSQIAIDLGFDVYTFKGATLTYTDRLTEKHIFLLNMNRIEFVYNPEAWFEPIDWKNTPNQLEKVMYIASMSPGLITAEPRRHCSMEYAS